MLNYQPKTPEFDAVKKAYEAYVRNPGDTVGRFVGKFGGSGVVATLIADGYLTEVSPDYVWPTALVKTDWEDYLVSIAPVPTPDLDRNRIVELLAKLEADTITNAELREVVKRDLKRRYL